MALDRSDDDFDDFDRPERHVPGGDVPARRPEPPESRSREEYYEALRVASAGKAADEGGEGPVRNVRGGIRLMPRTGRRPRTSASPRNGPPTYSTASRAVAAGIAMAREFPARPSSRRAGTTRRSLTLWSTSRGDLTCRPSIKNRMTDGWCAGHETM